MSASLRTAESLIANLQPNGTRLEGWDFIQEKALSHDEDMIADYADDIDTLLVFVSTDRFAVTLAVI